MVACGRRRGYGNEQGELTAEIMDVSLSLTFSMESSARGNNYKVHPDAHDRGRTRCFYVSRSPLDEEERLDWQIASRPNPRLGKAASFIRLGK